MDFDLLLRNRGVARVLVGVPATSSGLVARIESAAGDVITLEEATLAALARAYLTVTTDPTRQAIELRAATVPGGDGNYHLLDAGTPDAQLRSELDEGSADPPNHLPAQGPVTAKPQLPAPKHPFPARPTPAAALATEHGRPPEEDELDLEIDDSLADDESIFGEVPTQHSRPKRG